MSSNESVLVSKNQLFISKQISTINNNKSIKGFERIKQLQIFLQTKHKNETPNPTDISNEQTSVINEENSKNNRNIKHC
jgi:hypothetical protein